MSKATSIAALEAFTESGARASIRAKVVAYVARNGRATAFEAQEEFPEIRYPSLTARFSEATDEDELEEVGTREINGKEYTLYRATGRPANERLGCIRKIARLQARVIKMQATIASEQKRLNTIVTNLVV